MLSLSFRSQARPAAVAPHSGYRRGRGPAPPHTTPTTLRSRLSRALRFPLRHQLKVPPPLGSGALFVYSWGAPPPATRGPAAPRGALRRLADVERAAVRVRVGPRPSPTPTSSTRQLFPPRVKL